MPSCSFSLSDKFWSLSFVIISGNKLSHLYSSHNTTLLRRSDEANVWVYIIRLYWAVLGIVSNTVWLLMPGRRMGMTVIGEKERCRGKWLCPYLFAGTSWGPQAVELISDQVSKWVNHRRGMHVSCFVAVLTRLLKTHLYGVSLEIMFNRTSVGQVRTRGGLSLRLYVMYVWL
jgi:hypothetical protein